MNPRVPWKAASRVTLGGDFPTDPSRKFVVLADLLSPACAHMGKSVTREAGLSLNLNY